jgi:hypothetical protein
MRPSSGPAKDGIVEKQPKAPATPAPEKKKGKQAK